MNLSGDWIPALLKAGFEAVHWSSLGAIRADDTEIMEFARLHGFVVLTHDLDFGSLLAATRAIMPSVVQIRADDVYPTAIGIQVVGALHTLGKELVRGALVTAEPHRTRLRLLPFGFKAFAE